MEPKRKKDSDAAAKATDKAITLEKRKLRDPSNHEDKLSNKEYERELKKLHVELVKLQEWVKQKGLKVCVIFEGRDGAGKGGTIKAITERVMGFCDDEQAQSFLKIAPLFEKLMVESGIILLKYWLEVGPEEQTARLNSRIDDGRKLWKLTPMDLKSYDRWDDYTKARDEMFAATDTPWAPWFVANSEDKKRVRLNLISHLLSRIPYQKVTAKKVKLPKRKVGHYKAADYPFKVIPQPF